MPARFIAFICWSEINCLLPDENILILSLGMLCLFYVANSHEYLKSGVWYRDLLVPAFEHHDHFSVDRYRHSKYP